MELGLGGIAAVFRFSFGFETQRLSERTLKRRKSLWKWDPKFELYSHRSIVSQCDCERPTDPTRPIDVT